MFFNSLAFALFLPPVFALYWWLCAKSVAKQNALLLLASYVFYACWDWRFLFLLLFSTFLDYFTGLQIHQSERIAKKRFWFWLSIGVNLGFLGLFKYYDFFAVSFAELFQGFGLQVGPFLLKWVLPVGISFYTFHGLSYVIDIYKGRIPAEKNPIDYALFVSYFPLLVAGPIERATHLLPQIKQTRKFSFSQAQEGVYLIVWGLVKKVVIADTCATYANAIFDHADSVNTLSLVLGAVYFAFQIYGDFSGYSDMAIGISKLFGLELLRNFNYPYFSRDIAEFWRRWHISLSSWFRDYVYIPLGGSQGGKWMQLRNVFAIFILSGFWHGANWTYLFWGFLNALYFLPLLWQHKNRVNLSSSSVPFTLAGLRIVLNILATFALTCIAWVFFRAKSMTAAWDYLYRLATNGNWSAEFLSNRRYNFELLSLILLFVAVEWRHRNQMQPISGKYAWLKLGLCFAALLALGTYSDYKSFIYFQF
ncbi:MAG: Peptidoglycan O-acetyltransferase [Bacteroidota bacterium]|jgi:D-alanyl-lipoteichoic acid acyltransferase DltB (MBOAT superfamily)